MAATLLGLSSACFFMAAAIACASPWLAGKIDRRIEGRARIRRRLKANWWS